MIDARFTKAKEEQTPCPARYPASCQKNIVQNYTYFFAFPLKISFPGGPEMETLLINTDHISVLHDSTSHITAGLCAWLIEAEQTQESILKL